MRIVIRRRRKDSKGRSNVTVRLLVVQIIFVDFIFVSFLQIKRVQCRNYILFFYNGDGDSLVRYE